MPEVDPQQFGEVKANVANLLSSSDRIEKGLKDLVTKDALTNAVETIKTKIEAVDGRVTGLDEHVTDVDKRLLAVEEALKLERASIWARIRESITSSAVSIIGWALLLAMAGVIFTYIAKNYHIVQSPIDSKEGGK